MPQATVQVTVCGTNEKIEGAKLTDGISNSGNTNSAGEVTVSFPYNDYVMTLEAGGFQSVQVYLSETLGGPLPECLSRPTSGGGTSKECFISTAAYGSPVAPELQFQHVLRDSILLQTQWGRDWWAHWDGYYSRISPGIAGEMDADPVLRDLVRWGVVQPWVQYMTLVVKQPDWSQVDLERLDPQLREFLTELKAGMDGWLGEIGLPETLSGVSAEEAVRELDVILKFGSGGIGSAYLKELKSKGELPLSAPPDELERFRALLEFHGHDAEVIDTILGPA
jgi:hypothetical protein